MPESTNEQLMQVAVGHHQMGRSVEAEAIYRQVLAQNPNQADALHLLGVLRGQTGQHEEAVELIRRAISIYPSSYEYHFNIANNYLSLGRPDDAIAAWHEVIRLNPNHLETYINLGAALRNKNQFHDAIAVYTKAIELQPDFALAHGDLGMALLATGNFKKGWAEYEWRWACKDYPLVKRDFGAPQWRGEDLTGRRILLHAEQGLGDALMFCRFAPMVARRGGSVILECHQELTKLLQRLPGVQQVLAQLQPPPPVDFHSPLMSLPLVFGTDVDSIPAEVPYLSANAAQIESWRVRLDSGDKKLRVGLVWGGRSQNSNDRNRSVTLAQMAPLASIQNVRFYSLQKGPQASQIAQPPPGMELVEVGSQLQDFTDTAAVIANLDLVISVDTAIAHLAGALAKPIWVLTPYTPDWRWLLEREDSPWYPTMRLFRQQQPGQWADVMQRIAESLQSLVGN